jgi:molecular chaperone DnaJ
VLTAARVGAICRAVKDPYEVLGVARSATADEIKSAFRKLAAKHHPDKNPDDPGAGQRFKEINAAHQILSDPKKRAMFDRFGAAGVRGASAGGSGGPFGGMPIDFSELQIDGLFADLLEALGIRVGERGDVHKEMEISFEEAAFGCTKSVTYDRVARCADCDGTGAAPGTPLQSCPACNGKGRVRFQQGLFPIAVDRICSRCHGSGSVVTTPCPACSGAGLRASANTIEVTIPAGIEEGASRRVDGQGNVTRTGRRPGNLELLVHVRPHAFFRRAGDNVVCLLPITFAQASLGDEIEIPTLEGKGYMRVPAGTQPGTVLRVRGKGLPKRRGGRGDQLVEVQVEVPTRLSERQQQLIEELAKELGESVQPQRQTFLEKLKGLFS